MARRKADATAMTEHSMADNKVEAWAANLRKAGTVTHIYPTNRIAHYGRHAGVGMVAKNGRNPINI